MAKKRGIFKGRKRGGRERSSRPARVGASRLIDPGHLYALRAVVRELLVLCEEPHKLEDLNHKATRAKLRVWLEEADAWHRQVPVREREPDRPDGPVAPREGDSRGRGKAVQRCVVVRKRNQPPSWPAEVATLPSVEELENDVV